MSHASSIWRPAIHPVPAGGRPTSIELEIDAVAGARKGKHDGDRVATPHEP
jgi:hypothetical protein